MIKAVIFDIGGVIINNILRRMAKELAEKHGMDFEKLNMLIHEKWTDYKTSRISADEFWQHFVEASGVPENADELEKEALEDRELIPGTLDIIKSLKGKYKLGILSNNTDEWSKNEEERFRFSRIFDAIVLSNKERIAKPDKEFFDIVLERLGVNAGDCIFVDDQDNNVEAAQSYGFKTIKFENAGQLKQELQKMGVEI